MIQLLLGIIAVLIFSMAIAISIILNQRRRIRQLKDTLNIDWKPEFSKGRNIHIG